MFTVLFVIISVQIVLSLRRLYLFPYLFHSHSVPILPDMGLHLLNTLNIPQTIYPHLTVVPLS